MIDYSAKWPHPMSLTIGHIVGRAEGRARGWSERDLNTLANTRPEHTWCSNKSGAQTGRAIQGKRPSRAKLPIQTGFFPPMIDEPPTAGEDEPAVETFLGWRIAAVPDCRSAHYLSHVS
jgi:hypothetical protein